MEEEVKNIIEFLWQNEKPKDLLNKMADVNLYPKLQKEIPDKNIYITEIFSEEEIDTISERFRPYTKEYGIEPVISGYGNQTFCVGAEENNLGKVYYFDFNFGCFDLDCNIPELIESLIESDGKL